MAIAGAGHARTSPRTSGVCAFLLAHERPILGKWARAARQSGDAARRLPDRALVDHMPQLLRDIGRLADAIVERRPQEEHHEPAEHHALERFSEGFALHEVLVELSLFRRSIVETWAEVHRADEDVHDARRELVALNEAVDRVISATIESFVDRQAELLAARARVVAESEERARRHAEATMFLADASAILSSSLDYKTTLHEVARLAVPTLADWCVVDLVTGERTLERVAVAHHDPTRLALVEDLGKRFPPAWDARHGVARVIATGEPQVGAEVEEAGLVPNPREEGFKEMLDELGLRSFLIVPLVVRGRTIGALSLASSDSGRVYTPEDLPLTLELAHRAAVAVDNARLYEDAQQASKLRERVLAIVAHDLRNPVGTIMMAANLLLNQSRPDDPSRQFLEIIERGSKRMNNLIGDLLDMATFQSGRLSIERGVVRLLPVVNEVIEAHRVLANGKKIVLATECTLPSDCEVLADKDRIVQVFSNLVGNAIKFLRQGGTITIVAHDKPDSVELAVADDGPGIAAEDLPHLFKPFWSGTRTKSSGIGLGLYIAQGIVNAHGGRIEVDTTVGRGTRFSFKLPKPTPREIGSAVRTAELDAAISPPRPPSLT